jgi:fluoride exporter
MRNYVWVAIGSALGGVFRYGCALVASAWLGDAFPWGTTFINVLGSFIIGFFASATGPDGRWLVRPGLRVFVMVGFCGGYTTFSSFSLQTLNLMRAGEMGAAALNIIGSVVLCLAGVWVGYLVGALVNQARGG